MSDPAVNPAVNPVPAAYLSAEDLNRGCACRTLDPERLRRQLEAEPALAGLYEEIAQSRPYLFSATTVFISPEQYRGMAVIIAAIESVLVRPECQVDTLARAPAIARQDSGPRGVFMGFDLAQFALSSDRLML